MAAPKWILVADDYDAIGDAWTVVLTGAGTGSSLPVTVERP
jgi:hypothetical protein